VVRDIVRFACPQTQETVEKLGPTSSFSFGWTTICVKQDVRTVEEYLADLDQMNPVSGAEMISTTDPDAILTSKGGGTAEMAYEVPAVLIWADSDRWH
jgi:hypothetical protein